MSDILDAAIQYATERKWRVFPCDVSKKKSHKSEKYSGTKWGMTNDPAEIEKDWKRWPKAGIGVPCGEENGIWVLELDTKAGHNVDGQASLDKLIAQYGPLPDTLMAMSPSGSVHYYWQWTDGIRNSAGRIGEGIDVRGQGGMVVGVPSVRKDGVYKWINPGAQIAEAPKWLVDLALAAGIMGDPKQKTVAVAPSFVKPEHAGRGVSSDEADLPIVASDEEVLAALYAIDPHDLSYFDWASIGGALFAHFGKDGEQHFVSWSDWSKAKYPKATATPQSQFRRGCSTLTEFTVGTIFHFANEHSPNWRETYRQFKEEQAQGKVHEKESPPPDKPAPKKEPEAPVEEVKWPVLGQAAMFGNAWELCQAIAPDTEADPVAILFQLLVAFGNAIGRDYYYVVEGDRHHPNEFIAIVGDTSRGRKGTSMGRTKSVMEVIAPGWSDIAVRGGLSSGEGLINQVRDPTYKTGKDGEEECTDEGAAKRFCALEAEFAQLLSVMERQGNTISPIFRNAWDGSDLYTLTRQSPLKATNAHISCIGHITTTELKARLTATEAASGFGNRVLYVLARRSKRLPFGGANNVEVLSLASAIKARIERGGIIINPRENVFAGRPVEMTKAARELWGADGGIYDVLTRDVPGLLGSLTSRQEAHCVRLAMIIALFNGSMMIDEDHLRAAHALVTYCFDSAKYIFGDSLGDAVQDRINEALKHAYPSGMTRTQISALFGRNVSSAVLGQALASLIKLDLVSSTGDGKGGRGRQAEAWFHVPKSKR